jgi:uncharacterized small protein (DUF1192 family)
MTLSERINDLFNKFDVNLKTEEIEVNLEAQAVLENGTIIYTDAASFEEGAEVYIINEEGEKIPLPEGDYELDDGSKMSIGEGGKVSKAPRRGGEGEGEGESGEGGDSGIGDGGTPPKGGKAPKSDPPAKTPPPKKKKSAQEKLAEEADVADWEGMEKRIKNLEDGIADLKARLDEKSEVIDAEEVEAGEKEEEKVEYSAQTELEELKAQLEAQSTEITELKSQAASEGVKRVTPTAPKTEAVDLTKLSTEERIKALFNQFNKA